MKRDILEDRLIDFSVEIVHLTNTLYKSNYVKIISDQIIRSGLSVALNYGEAQSAESRKDFIHKMRISLKELRETKIALKIISKTIKNSVDERLKKLLIEVNELISIFVASVNTATKNLQNLK